MRIHHRYLTYSHSKIIRLVRGILDKYSIYYKYKEDLNCVVPGFNYSLEFHLFEDDPFFEEVKQAINKFNIEPQIGTQYGKDDIKMAEWFFVNTGEYQYPQPDEDFGYLNATFNLDNYCKLCGIGKLQNAPYRLKTEPRQPNNQFWGLHWEFEAVFLRQEAKNILEKENIKGIRFSKPVLNKKNIEIEGFYQLHIDTILENGFDSYNTRLITCKIDNEENLNNDKNSNCCGRVKFHHPMIGGYNFDKSIFSSAFDIVQSKEYFGSGGSANRLQIVSKKFKSIIEANKLKGLSFTPIVHDRLKR